MNQTESGGQRRIRVWDLFVRLFHWSLVAVFFIAYFTEDEAMALHAWAGYAAGGLVLLRIVWGFVGPRHARFSDFVCGPSRAIRYVVDLAAFRAKRHIGHSPAGGAMALMLMAGILATVWSGMELYAADEGKGPLAGNSPVVAQALANGEKEEEKDDDEDDDEKNSEDFWEDTHDVLANLTFLLVIIHLGGVILASIVHRENLIGSLITGYKRSGE